MGRTITRRDFMNGAAMMVGSSMLPGSGMANAGQAPEPQNRPGYDPPISTGLRGSHPGSFETAHSLRDGTFWSKAGKPIELREKYDLVVVGGGISGLAAAHFFRERVGTSARILILENHDDFGGHGKRNEFHLDGRLALLNGGTLEIDSPTPYSPEAGGLIRKLGIDPPAFEKKYSDQSIYQSLGLSEGIFFDQETFGADKLVVGVPRHRRSAKSSHQSMSWAEFLALAPLSPTVQRDVARIEEAQIDYMAGLTSAEKKDRLSRISYKDFLLNVAKVDPGVVPFYQKRTHGEWGVGIDAEPALDCWALGLPGFQGMDLQPGAAPRMSYTAAGYANGGSYQFHFPDGNASIARLLVRNLIPLAVPGSSAEDVVTAEVDYSQLDRAGSPLRIRLNSTVVRVQNLGDPSAAQGVEVAYASGGQVYNVRAGHCVLACWNMVIPYLCPALPAKQKEALHYLVKVPLIYTSVAIRNWTSLQKLGVHSVSAPGAYWLGASLNWPMKMGSYNSSVRPQEPVLVHLSRTPCKPGLPVREQQIAGRQEIQATTFETYERTLRDQLQRTFHQGGFDPARDIEAITVNRWPHGYGYEYNPLFDPEWPEGEQPHIVGRKQFGRIAIANTDSGATAYTDVAINQAFRAVNELLADGNHS
jgi:spermidine dehydrogenase